MTFFYWWFNQFIFHEETLVIIFFNLRLTKKSFDYWVMSNHRLVLQFLLVFQSKKICYIGLKEINGKIFFSTRNKCNCFERKKMATAIFSFKSLMFTEATKLHHDVVCFSQTAFAFSVKFFNDTIYSRRIRLANTKFGCRYRME